MRLKKHLFFATVFILAILMSAFAHFRNSRRLVEKVMVNFCLLYTSDSADDSLRLDRGGRLII